MQPTQHRVLLVGDPRNNYMETLAILARRGVLAQLPEGEARCSVRHWATCSIYDGGLCDCPCVLEIGERIFAVDGEEMC